MTVRPLTEPFADRSPLARCDPWQVPYPRLAAEVAAELDRRRGAYTRRPPADAAEREERDRHLAAWSAIADDVARTDPAVRGWTWSLDATGPLSFLDHGRPARTDGPAYRLDWPARIRELRRELALRRAQYPRRVQRPTDVLTADAAAAACEALDAVHWRYWHGLAGFTPPGLDHADDAVRHAWVARRERDRIAALADQAPALPCAIAWQGWTDVARLADFCADGGIVANATDAATRARLLAIADAALEAAHDDPILRDARIAQLGPLHRWLTAAAFRPGRRLPPRPAPAAPPTERLAA